jgi:hypothetical protein
MRADARPRGAARHPHGPCLSSALWVAAPLRLLQSAVGLVLLPVLLGTAGRYRAADLVRDDTGPSPDLVKGQVMQGAPPGTRTPNPRMRSRVGPDRRGALCS